MAHWLKTKTPFSLINKIKLLTYKHKQFKEEKKKKKSDLLRLLSSLFFPYLFSSATKNFRIILYVLDLICRRFLVFSSLLYCWNIDPTSKEPSVNHFLCYFKEIVVKLASMRSSTKFEIVLCNSDFYFYFFRTWLRQ